jgi:hypothetical protein
MSIERFYRQFTPVCDRCGERPDSVPVRRQLSPQGLFHALLGIASPGMNMVIQSRMYLNATEFNEGVEMMGGVTVADLLEADGNKSDKIREQKDDPK